MVLEKASEMLAVKVVGVEFRQPEERRLENTLHVTVQLKNRDGKVVTSAVTTPASRVGDVCVWNNEVSLLLSPDTASVMSSVVFELRAGLPDATPKGAILATASLPWEYVSSTAAEAGVAIKPNLTMTMPVANGGRLLGRLQYANAQSAATRLVQLREAYADATAASGAQSTALTATVAEAAPHLAAIKNKVFPRVRGAARLVAEKEIAAFRKALESRLHTARAGRDTALSKFSEVHQGKLIEEMPSITQARLACGSKLAGGGNVARVAGLEGGLLPALRRAPLEGPV